MNGTIITRTNDNLVYSEEMWKILHPEDDED